MTVTNFYVFFKQNVTFVLSALRTICQHSSELDYAQIRYWQKTIFTDVRAIPNVCKVTRQVTKESHARKIQTRQKQESICNLEREKKTMGEHDQEWP